MANELPTIDETRLRSARFWAVCRPTGSDRGCEHASVTAWVDVATPKRGLWEVGRPLQCKQLKLALMGVSPISANFGSLG